MQFIFILYLFWLQIFSQHRIDHLYALAFFWGLPKKMLHEILKKMTNQAGQNYRRLMVYHFHFPSCLFANSFHTYRKLSENKNDGDDFCLLFCLQALAKVGNALGKLHKEPDVASRCQLMETSASWGHQLGKFKVRNTPYILYFLYSFHGIVLSALN